MSQFSRRARWLTQLFPSSIAPRSRDPGVLSDDVSLVQQYFDGYSQGNELDWYRFIITPASASGTDNIFSVAEDNIFRLLGASATRIAGANALMRLSIFGFSPGSVGSVIISEEQTIDAFGSILALNTPILPPNTTVEVVRTGGDAASIFSVNVFGIEVPLGTVFHL